MSSYRWRRGIYYCAYGTRETFLMLIFSKLGRFEKSSLPELLTVSESILSSAEEVWLTSGGCPSSETIISSLPLLLVTLLTSSWRPPSSWRSSLLHEAGACDWSLRSCSLLWFSWCNGWLLTVNKNNDNNYIALFNSFLNTFATGNTGACDWIFEFVDSSLFAWRYLCISEWVTGKLL